MTNVSLYNGKIAIELQPGQFNVIKAKAGEHYRVVKGTNAASPLLEDVIAKRAGKDLKLAFGDGTQVTLDNFYEECKAGGCEVTLPAQGAGEYLISAGAQAPSRGLLSGLMGGGDVMSAGAALGDGSSLTYAFGNPESLMSMAQGQAGLQSVLSGLTGTSISYVPVATSADTSGMSLGLLGAVGLGLAGLAGGGGSAHNIVSGVVLGGPVVAGHGLTVKLYQADGVTLLGNTTTLSSSGAFSIAVGNYTGVVIAKLEDSGLGNDFWDEATGLSKDLNANLMAVGVSTGGPVTLNINPLTTLAASKAGAVFAGANNPAGSISVATVDQINTAVASVFGLTDLTGTSVVTTVNADGSANAAFTPASLNAGVKYGAVLAALSGMDQVNSGDMQATLTALSNGLSVDGNSATLSQSTIDAVVKGAKTGNNQLQLEAILTNLLDIVPPTLLISSSTAALKIGQTANITFTFSEVPEGFAAADVSTTNGTLSVPTVISAADPKVYTATFTPTPGLTSGNASITVASGAYKDAAGNNGGAGSTPAISIDTLAPTLAITSNVAAVRIGESATITFTFSEEPVGFAEADVSITNGSLSAPQVISATDPKVYTATFTPTPRLDAPNTASITVANSSYTDAAGNNGGAGLTPNLSIDTLAPTQTVSNVRISDDNGDSRDFLTNTAEQTITAELSAALAAGDKLFGYLDNKIVDQASSWIDITNKVIDKQINWNGATFLSGSNVNAIKFKITDAAGNSGSVFGPIAYELDTTAPTLTITSDVSAVKIGETANITFTFSELPIGFDAGDITASNGDLIDLKVSDDPKVYTAIFTPKDKLNEGAAGNSGAAIRVLAVTYKDSAGNTGAFDSDLSTPTSIDTLAPNVTNTNAAYISASNSLVLTGLNYNSLLNSNENSTTDLSARLDLTHLSWTITHEQFIYTNSQLPDVVKQFTAQDIKQVFATNNSTLTITLSDSAAIALEKLSGYGGVKKDLLAITTGFVKDKAGNLSTTDAMAVQDLNVSPFMAGDKVIDLDERGQLILPVQVDDGRWYYFWDLSGNGASTPQGQTAGTLNGGKDYTTHDNLDLIFQENYSGVVTAGDSTEAKRYATINGVHLALPTVGGVLVAPYGATGINNFQPGTSVGSATPTNGSNALNDAYNDYLAIWDAYNGTGTAGMVSGTPSGWVDDSYWTASPSTDVTAHAYVFLANGFVFGGAPDSKNGFVALEALTLDTQAPSPPIINPVTADNTINAAEVGSQITGQNETGATVALTFAGVVHAATVMGSNWSYTLTAADITAMQEGPETLSVTQTDPALNVSLAATREIKVDTIAPTATNTSGFYTSATNTLVLTGSNYQTMWESGEGNTTDIKARLDWSKLFWDINADDAVTPNVTFNVSDIISAKVTQAGELTVVLTNEKGRALEATRYYGGTAIDTLDILAGFDRDTAGNPAATDAKANAPLTVSAFVPGDLVIDLGANGQLIKPVNLAGNNWIYYWDKNGDGSSQSASLFNNASDTISHTTLNGIFNKSSTGSTGIGTDDTYRFTTLNGVNVALPTAGQYPNAFPPGWADSLTYWSATPSFNGSFQSVNPASGGATPFVGSSTLYVALQVLPTTVTINDVAEDDTINISEQNTTLTGLNAAGASVALSIGGNTRAATVNGTNWSYTLTQADINAMGQGPETLSATQTVAGVTGTPVTHDITVDTISPIATHTSASYTSQSNTLVITGSNYQSLWVFSGENNTTDIKARLDWSKLSWDTNYDDALTAIVSFVLADIASAKVTTDGQLTVVLTDIKGAALEATSRYGGATADALDIAAGFSKDKAGNASSTEAKADLPLSVSAFVAGDKVIDLDSFGQLILPKQVDGGKYYYYWDRSASTSIANTGLLNGGVDYVTHDVLDDIFKQDINGNFESNSNAVGAVGETDDIFRYASLNGVPLALPTSGGGLTGIYAKTGSPTETVVGSDPASDGSNADNARFNDLLALWDAYNGTRTLAVSASSGLPPGWENAYYWSATPSLQTDSSGINTQGHALVQLSQNVVEGSFPDINPYYVVLQVFPGAVSAAVIPPAPTINPVATDNIISANEQLTTITGTNQAGATVNLMFSSGVVVNNVPVMITREAVVTGTTWSYTLVEADIVAMGEGDETLKANQTNASGNTSDTVSLAISIGPTVVNTSAAYTSANNTLVLTGTGYDILRGSDPVGTDIKAKLDWSKLKWDINGDDASTADVSFELGDIVSATAADNTHLTVVLTTAKGALLEATRYYGGTALNNIDTLDITAGFAKDFAGTLRPTDAKANATLSVSAFAAGDAVIDLGLGGQLIKPVQVDGGKFYYFWDRSGDGIANLEDATSHNSLDSNFTLNTDGAVGTVGETDNTFRFADVLGVKVALPTLGAAANATGVQNGTVVGSVDASIGSNLNNPTYDDMMAIWDAYNGQGGNVAGVPPGWMAGNYASATPAALLHAGLNLSTGTVDNDNPEDSINLFVALQVL